MDNFRWFLDWLQFDGGYLERILLALNRQIVKCGNSIDKAKEVLDALIEANKGYFPELN